MKNTIILFLLLILNFEGLFSQYYKKISVSFDDNFTYKKFLELGFDLEGAIFKENVFAEIIVNQFELEILKQNKANFVIISDDYENELKNSVKDKIDTKSGLNFQGNNLLRGTYADGYFKLDEIYSILDSIYEKNKDLIQKYTIGKTYENRDIFIYRLGKETQGTGQSTNSVMFIGTTHPREVASPFLIVNYFNNLIKRYESKDSNIVKALNSNTVYFLPVLNPDGYVYNATNRPDGGGLWRKNRSKINDSTYGVDLNRNYGPMSLWDYNNNGSSLNPVMETYRGEYPFSENETKAVRDFLRDRNIDIIVDIHSYGGAILNPLSASATITNDSMFFDNRGIYNYIKMKYLSGFDFDILNYPSRGSSMDYFYTGESNISPALSYIVEIGSVQDGFWCPVDTTEKNTLKLFPFMDDIIYSTQAYYRPISMDLKKNYNYFTLNLEFINLGSKINDNCYFEIKPLNVPVELSQPLRYIYNHKPGEIKKYLFDFVQTGPMKNGITGEFEIITYHFDNRIYRDTLKAVLYNYREIELDDVVSQDTYWNLLGGDWFFSFDKTEYFYYLTSNRKDYYDTSMTTYAEYIDYINVCKDCLAFLTFDTKFNIETNWDIGLIDVFSNNKNTWNSLIYKDMVQGLNINPRSIIVGKNGYYGTFRSWFKQVIPLEGYDEDDIRIRFGLISDKAGVRTGWNLRNIIVRIYDDKTNNIDDISGKNVQVYPNPIFNDNYLNISVNSESKTNLELIIHDILGNKLLSKSITPEESNLRIPFEFESGIYFLMISEKSKIILYDKIIKVD